MPKIRGVKPDYWTDEDIVGLSVPARLLFIGLWTYACDNGHLQDKPKQIKMRVFPGDDVNATELLKELEAAGRITRGDGWITVPNLTEHQRPDRRYFTTCDKDGCEDPPQKVSQRESRRVHGVHTPGTPSAHAERTPGAHVDGDGDGEVMVKGTAAGSRVRTRATSLSSDWAPNERHLSLAAERGANVESEAHRFRDYSLANGKTYKDWDAAFRNWLTSPYQKPAEPVRHLTHARDLEKPPDGLDPEQYAAWERDRRRA